MVKVLINGYGSIGKRVADAVAKQRDMEVLGVTKTKPDFEARLAVEKGYKLYAAIPERLSLFEERGIEVEGTILDVIEEADIVVDCTPSGVGRENLKMYKQYKVKAILQGGEKAQYVEDNFNALWSYERCYGKNYVRVVSCNTTGLCRTLYAIDSVTDIVKVRAVLVRRGADPHDIKRGPINAIVPNPPTLPSHHGPDVVSVIPELEGKIFTSAVVVPTTLMHMHTVMVETTGTTRDDIIEGIERTPRVFSISAEEGFHSTAAIVEFARDIGRMRYDIYEIAVWEESINVVDNEVFLMQAIHQESDVVPENIDCIRAMLEITDDNMKSIEMTDKALGIGLKINT
ncbi:MAG TPA: type II glyceraldehyde-3-phosphate dehydrogenase [Methanococcaceae archaeon]|uniref:Glyceraldehyde-3-phosphate dehydrogenase n=1 Tax=Methanothermococcus okinawensis TaxID=155863 RepID=A0A832ZMP5_9EURY|nr:type II glyceraldehyde-3-phosphate dehydrogenase [Methanococcaceae archaeon]HIP91731.1 type II glyceraldehyde-3-phosphate dehydrogenase [Methanothermococcus okinawensis]